MCLAALLYGQVWEFLSGHPERSRRMDPLFVGFTAFRVCLYMNNYWQEKLKIKNLEFSRFISGPLDGITDSPFRKLVREFSPENLLYTEMRHVACVANAKSSHKTLNFEVFERPLNYQVAANSTVFIKSACDKILEKGVDLIDLNICCPARNFTSSGGGSSLMADTPRLKEIVTELRNALPNTPFTVKIRAGFKEKNAVDVAKMLQDCGVDALAIHPRLRDQYFEGQPDYDLAAQVKRALNIPVILSGNVVNFKTAKMAYERTGVDGYLIGRGIWGRPWKLKEMDMHSQGLDYDISHNEIITIAIKHFEYMLAYYEGHGVYCFRKHLPFYLRGFNDASALRQHLVSLKSPEEVRQELFKLLDRF